MSSSPYPLAFRIEQLVVGQVKAWFDDGAIVDVKSLAGEKMNPSSGGAM